MKKIVMILTTLILALVLVSCKKDNKTFAKAELNNVESFSDSIKFDLDIIDPNNEIPEDRNIRLEIYKKDGTVLIDNHSTSKVELKDSKTFSFTKLDPDQAYTIFVKTTIAEESILLFQGDYETNLAKGRNEVDVNTVEDFFKIKNDTSAIYNLKADLDFEEHVEDINKNLIRTFTGEFNGNGHTIKNYHITDGVSYYGIFGTLSGNAYVKDLVLDNVSLTITTSGSTRVAGLLFGRITGNTAYVDNIKIYNSSLTMKLDSESTSHDIGLLGGRSTGTISNIYIDENTKLTINAEKIKEPKIGGVIGNSNDKNAVVKNVEVLATIEFNLNQKSTSGLRGNPINIYIGGVMGYGWQLTVNNLVSKANIDLKELNFHVEKLLEETTDKTNKYISLMVGGLFGQLGNTKLEEALYEGDINISKINITNHNLEEDENTNEMVNKLPYKYLPLIEVGSFLGRFGKSDVNLVNVLRVNGAITVANQEATTEVKEGLLIGVVTTTNFYNQNNKFGYLGFDVTGSELVRVVNALEDLFSETSFVYKKYNGIE